jgi:hypothetical protein
VTSKEVPLSQANAIEGLRAVFGEVRLLISVFHACYVGVVVLLCVVRCL